jgi:single-strand DNA-binding protein
MSSLNKASLLGRLGKDPESFTTQQGVEIAKFSLATSETWKGKDGEKKERTEWHNVVIYNEGLSGVAMRYLKKGSQCYIEGKISTRKYEAKDGTEKYITEIVLDTFNGKLILVGKPPEGGASDDEAPPSQRKRTAAPAKKESQFEKLDDEVPF